MDKTIDSWLQENKWLTLSDHFHGHKFKKNDLHTFTGLCREIDKVWDEVFHNQEYMDRYIEKCDLQNILYTKHILDTLKIRLRKLGTNLKYKSEAFMGNIIGTQPEAIQRAKEYSMIDILERFGCKVRHGRCACPVHGGKNSSSFSVKNNTGYCHCGWHGDSIALWMKLWDVDFVTAVKELQ
jgi:hypothetical protein